jgi:nucleoid-associated protein YgaU
MAEAAHRALGRQPAGSAGSARRPVLALALVSGAAVAVVLVRSAVAAARLWAAQPVAARSPGQLLGWLCAGSAGLLLGWLTFAALVTVLAAVPGRLGRRAADLSARLAPTVLRAAIAATLGGSLALSTLSAGPSPQGTAVTAVAAGSPTPSTAVTPEPASASASTPPPDRPAVGWRPAKPDRPIVPPADIGLVSTSPTVGRSPDEEVVVRRSDTLWSIAARHLGDHASAAEIAHEWPRWFAANRPVIGADPDRLVPGQRLVPPR